MGKKINFCHQSPLYCHGPITPQHQWLQPLHPPSLLTCSPILGRLAGLCRGLCIPRHSISPEQHHSEVCVVSEGDAKSPHMGCPLPDQPLGQCICWETGAPWQAIYSIRSLHQESGIATWRWHTLSGVSLSKWRWTSSPHKIRPPSVFPLGQDGQSFGAPIHNTSNCVFGC